MRIHANPQFRTLRQQYVFSAVEQRVAACAADGEPLLRLGIGDVRGPLFPCVVEAMAAAVREMGEAASFRGYAPEGGYPFLREALAAYYAAQGIGVAPDEIFISDGAKSDAGDLLDLTAHELLLLPDPVYPAYEDAARLAGHPVLCLRGQDGLLPEADAFPPTPCIAWICSPNNPTGAVYSRASLQRIVDWARSTGSLLLFDAAYSAFVRGDAPRSVYELDGAEACSIEVGSFSKSACFTGVRCGWSVIPHALKACGGTALLPLWQRRQAARRNGVSYITQRGAQAALTPEGLAASRTFTDGCLRSAAVLRRALTAAGLSLTGGTDAPYLWVRCPDGVSSWDWFEDWLQTCRIVTTPGCGFGEAGEGYLRLSAFCRPEEAEAAAKRVTARL